MTTVAEFRIPAEEFALADFFAQYPSARVEILNGTAFSQTGLSPCIWVVTDDPEPVDEALQADESISDVNILTTLEDRRLYQVEWQMSMAATLGILLEDGMVLQTTGTSGDWELRVLFPAHDGLSIVATLLRENDLTVDVKRVYQLSDPNIQGDELTDGQREALQTAVKRGYFDVPRGVTMGDLADEFDISQQALSERIRRAHRNLLKAVLDENSSE